MWATTLNHCRAWAQRRQAERYQARQARQIQARADRLLRQWRAGRLPARLEALALDHLCGRLCSADTPAAGSAWTASSQDLPRRSRRIARKIAIASGALVPMLPRPVKPLAGLLRSLRPRLRVWVRARLVRARRRALLCLARLILRAARVLIGRRANCNP